MVEKIEIGPTGRTVAQSLANFRKGRKMSYPELSRAVAEKGWKLPVLALRRIEEGKRKVTVDDAVYLALALDVPLTWLLLPDERDWDYPQGHPAALVIGADSPSEASPMTIEELYALLGQALKLKAQGN